jgi:hypothetical protein
MRYFDFLVEELKKAKLRLQANKISPLKTDDGTVNEWYQELLPAIHTQLWHEMESFNPREAQLILMDAQQALIFSEKENPEDHWQEVIKAPFPNFFLEFSEPIALNQPEPLTPEGEKVFGTDDFVHAISYRTVTHKGIKGYADYYDLDPSIIKDDEYAFITFLCQTNGHGTREAQHTIDGKTINARPFGMEQMKIFSPGMVDGVCGSMIGVLLNEYGEAGQKEAVHHARAYNLLKDPDDLKYETIPVQRINRTFLYHVKTGKIIVATEAVKDYFEDPSQLPKDYPFKTITAGDSLGIEDRYIGWYERSLLTYASLTNWTLLYLMAKGIEIVEEPLSRSEKRRRKQEAKKIKKTDNPYPNNWHIIQSKPRFSDGNSNGSSNGNGSGKPHRFRYDVMGHLRNGRHQLKDGTWKLTLEWVPAHQRGLNNSLYIPAIRKAEVNKKSDERNYEYFRKPGELP